MGVKTAGVVKNLYKGQLDSQVPTVRPRSKEAVSPDPGRGLEVHALKLLNYKCTELEHPRHPSIGTE